MGDKFEKNLGIVLRNSWLHVEALQTTDLPGLLQYMESIITNILDSPDLIQFYFAYGNDDVRFRQEVYCFNYIKCIFLRIGDLSEGR